MEKTFEELIADKVTQQQTRDGQYTIYPDDALELMQQVREATITEAVNYCVSQDWVKTIDNLKKMPTDRIKLTEQ